MHCESPLVGVLVTRDDRRLIALHDIEAGAVLFRLNGRETATPTRYSIQIGAGVHLDQDASRNAADIVRRFCWRYMNHHCEPTTVIRGREVVALRAITQGESVTFDYNTTEVELAEPFVCHCGSARCIGQVRGARYLTPEQRARLAGFLAPHVQ